MQCRLVLSFEVRALAPEVFIKLVLYSFLNFCLPNAFNGSVGVQLFAFIYIILGEYSCAVSEDRTCSSVNEQNKSVTAFSNELRYRTCKYRYLEHSVVMSSLSSLACPLCLTIISFFLTLDYCCINFDD